MNIPELIDKILLITSADNTAAWQGADERTGGKGMKKEHEVISNRKMSDREKELWEELQKLAKFMYEKFPEYETTNDESFVHKAIRIIVDLKSQLASIKYLNADEVKVLTRGLVTEIKYYDDLFSDPNCPNTNHKEIEENLISLFIKDICKLAIPDIDRDKIIEVLDEK